MGKQEDQEGVIVRNCQQFKYTPLFILHYLNQSLSSVSGQFVQKLVHKFSLCGDLWVLRFRPASFSQGAPTIVLDRTSQHRAFCVHIDAESSTISIDKKDTKIGLGFPSIITCGNLSFRGDLGSFFSWDSVEVLDEADHSQCPTFQKKMNQGPPWTKNSRKLWSKGIGPFFNLFYLLKWWRSPHRCVGKKLCVEKYGRGPSLWTSLWTNRPDTEGSDWFMCCRFLNGVQFVCWQSLTINPSWPPTWRLYWSPRCPTTRTDIFFCSRFLEQKNDHFFARESRAKKMSLLCLS